MFVERGFDNVTVTEIADAAGVSKVTVFNYFPRKEDIFFDRFPQVRELLTRAVDGADEPVPALRALFLDLAEQGHPIGGLQDRYVPFWHTVLASPTLRARAREAMEEFEAHLAGLLADRDHHPRLTAALVLAAVRAVFTEHAARVLAGEKADRVTPDYLEALRQAFATLAEGLR